MTDRIRGLVTHPAAITGLVRAILTLLVALNFPVSTQQQDALLDLVGSILAILSLVITGVTINVTQAKPSAATGDDPDPDHLFPPVPAAEQRGEGD